MKINPFFVIKQKENVVVGYYDFNYYFFKNETAVLILQLIENFEKTIQLLPISFLQHLISIKMILVEKL